ncbi:hypothetical protein Aph02nite_84640 [Actinoplanes philippinensis]|uniref:PEP-CTERM protein-sorting domain-containing protein n=1 Tax=Actinoplanes philippinensis TaxID=35752 RepID=A0A1I2EQK3_9ACTN|nr:DUF6069 family protein [Actinoplanes philippinensis]GIE82514.1 hypothetical protein Aph02nite_84640 [Actinoplanes philippinensis]SFE94738.1 hypothetical protein SAMN05421541_104630 [Actinoplanes philippinensis]
MTAATAPAVRSTWKATFAAAAIGAAGGLVVNTLIAVAARALGAPDEFQQLTLPVYGTLTVLGALIAAVAWRLIVNRSRNAGRVLRVLVPVVLLISLIPDFLLLASKSQPGTTTGGVVALILMHFGVAAVAVPAFRKLMPPRS